MLEMKAIFNTQEDVIYQVETLLSATFPWAYPTRKDARADLFDHFRDEGLLCGAFEGDVLLGAIGAKPQYGLTGWELHPLMVAASHRKEGIGSMLLTTLENEVKARGGIMMYLGTDDEHDQTSLSQTDLFDDPFSAIQAIRNLKNHPYTFYQKHGYQIVGVLPDANGLNKPDIYMAKSLIKKPSITR